MQEQELVALKIENTSTNQSWKLGTFRLDTQDGWTVDNEIYEKTKIKRGDKCFMHQQEKVKKEKV